MSSVTSTSGSANAMRITGMATGMDTDAMVKAMTSNYQYKIDKANQQKQIGQWKQDMYRDIIKDVKGLQDYFDPTSSKYILGQNKFNPIKVANSNEGIVGFSASSTAQAGNYKIDVDKLAKPAVVSGGSISGNVGTNSNLIASGLASDGQTLEFNITSSKGSSTASITVAANTTIQSVLDEFNKNTSGAKASFDELSKKFVFTTDDFGKDSNLVVGIDNTSTANKANFKLELLPTVVTEGQNAEFTLTYPDGRQETITNQTSNQFTANGITYNLKSTGTSNITVEKNNVDSVVDNLKKFIDDYNSVVDKIQGKLTEKKQFRYNPLTDEQKKDMKESDIANWETKAKQGLLKNDENLGNLLRDLRSAFTDNVFSKFVDGTPVQDQNSEDKNKLRIGSFSDNAIGIDTSSELGQLGKIVITDEAKLKAAISNNIEEFTKMFIGKSTENLKDPVTGVEKQYAGSKKYYEDGIFTRMDRMIRTYAGDPGIGKDGTSTVKGILNIFTNKQYDFSITGYSSKNTLPDQIYRKTVSISDLQRKLDDAQSRYYKKFAALEKAMNQMNSQMSNFQSQMGTS